MKSREHITNHGKASFYASIWPDLMKAANNWNETCYPFSDEIALTQLEEFFKTNQHD